MVNLSQKVPLVMCPELKAEIIEARDASSYSRARSLLRL
jgi:hypothetical protein